MSSLKTLKSTKTLSELSDIFRFSPSALAFILYKIPDDKKYHSFQIKKKNGGNREIRAPEQRLKKLQRRLANLLNSCVSELEKEKKKEKKKGKKRRQLAHGFKKELSIHTNAKLHKNRRFVLNFDLENFFPAINFGRVRGYFIKNRDFDLPEKVATIIAQIACHENELPQGSPCSPIISNLIAHLLDVRLVQLAKKYGCSYSRYADDITFSTNQKEFPKEIALQDAEDPQVWHLNEVLKSQVTRSGFNINSQKTHMRSRNNRQIVTGLVVNKKVNVRSEYYKLARAMTCSLFHTGGYRVPANFSPIDIPGDASEVSRETKLTRLEGILNHIHYTKGLSDHRDEEQKQIKPTAILKLLRKFIFCKHFCASERPVIICEGVTDRIYLRLALKKLKKSYPSLVELNDKKLYYKINFLKFSRNIRSLLKIGTGASQLAKFAGAYEEKMKKYPAWSVKQPVILLIDNDSGAKPVFNVVKNITGSKSNPTIQGDEDFYFINNNLYLVKTPHLGTGMGETKMEETTMEDFIDPKWFKKIIDGQPFSLGNKFSEDELYGKVKFAEGVIAKNYNDVNFDKFGTLLDRIVAVIDHHKKGQAAAP